MDSLEINELLDNLDGNEEDVNQNIIMVSLSELLNVESSVETPTNKQTVGKQPPVICNEIGLDHSNHPKKKTWKRYSQGRPRDPIRDDFEELQSGKMQCVACGTKVTNRADVMKNHKRVCKGKPRIGPKSRPDDKQTETQIELQKADLSSVASEPTTLAPVPANLNETPVQSSGGVKRGSDWNEAPVSKKPLRSFLDSITPKEQHMLDKKMAKAMYACNQPFRQIENPEFRDALKALRPAYTPPDRKYIANELLDETFNEVKSSLKDAIRGKQVVMIQDGWSTNQNQPVIAHSIQFGSRTYFFNAIYTGTNAKTADYCFELIENAIASCEQENECTVIGVVTDNCKVMINLRAKISTKYPQLFVYGCNAHYLNLVGRKMTPTQKIEDIVTVQKYFKNHHFQSTALTENKGKRPVLPTDTRWNSQLDCIQNFLENHALYLDILRKNPKKFDSKIALLINNTQLYDDAVKWKRYAEPVSRALNKAQSNNSTLSDVTNEWIKLKALLDFETEEEKTYFMQKYNDAVNPVASAAHLLDPRYRGKGLAISQCDQAYELMSTINPDLMIVSMELQALNEEKFPRYLMNEEVLAKIDPATFWILVEKQNLFNDETCQLAQRLQRLPGSASSIERCFSTLKSILSSARTRLGVDKASKLCIINQSLRFMRQDSIDWDDGD